MNNCYRIPLLLYYAHKIPLLDVLLSYGTRYHAKECNPFSSQQLDIYHTPIAI
jgi:hypothetical protein